MVVLQEQVQQEEGMELSVAVQQVAEQQIEGNGRPGMAKVGISINGRTTHIHAHVIRVYGHKPLLGAG